MASYPIPKHDVIQIPVETPSSPAAQAPNSQPSAAKTKGRMLAALVLDGQVSWSFKALTAPDQFPASAAADFEELIKSMKFENSQKPAWELGEKWQERAGGGMRTANLMLGELEFSVIKLPVPSSDKDQYVLQNVNRWRGQLSLAPVGLEGLPESVRTIQTQDGHEATLLDLTGMQSGSAMGPMARRTPPPSSAAAPTKPFTDQPPTHWQATKAGMMQLATYLVESDGKTAKVSISRAGGDILANINRWRGQVSLSPLGDLEEAKLQDVQVGGLRGLLAKIDGESGQSIVVAMLPADRPTWFFKLQGDTSLVQKEAEPFEAYLDTVQLE